MLAIAMLAAALATGYPVEEKSISDIKADLACGKVTSVELVKAYQARIQAIDVNGPALHSIIALNPKALAEAQAADAARAAGRPQGALAGVPVLVKDNIETSDGTATTAGSLALKDNVTLRDAPVVARMKAAGAIILGKTNLSEWANIRSSHSISGWSAMGGLVKNPYALNRNACGSSSGTGASIAASLAAGGVGTETDGSVTCPASLNGLVGLKPTVGLVSRTFVVPISHSQDTPGPMTRSVADAALMLTAMAGSDPKDAATAQADQHVTNYLAALQGATLKGKRLGVLRYATGLSDDDDRLFEATLEKLRAAGAEIVEIKDFRPDPAMGVGENQVLMSELKADLNAYLATTPAAVTSRTLADVIAFNAATPRELVLFGQDEFETAQRTRGLEDPLYQKARAQSLKAATEDGIDKLLETFKVDALVAPSYVPAWFSDVTGGARGGGRVSGLAAVAGYPNLTVPMGQIHGLPVGFAFIGPVWSEARLLALGAAFEAVVQGRKPPTYAASVESMPEVAKALAPPLASPQPR